MSEFIVGDVASGAAAGTAISPGLGTIIGAGLGIAGSIFGRKSKPAAPVYDDKYFQRSVKDAKAAGLHPLFALGGGGAPSSGFIAGQSQSGSRLGDALKTASRAVPEYARVTAQNPLQAKLANLQIQDAEINIRKSLIDEQMMLSELSRTVQASYSTGQDSSFYLPPATVPASQISKGDDLVEIKPHEIVTKRSDDAAKTTAEEPGWDMVRIHKNLPAIMVPQSDEGWGEDLTIGKIAIIIAANSAATVEALARAGIKGTAGWRKMLKETFRKIKQTAPPGGGRIRR